MPHANPFYGRAVVITKSDTVNYDFTTETQRAAAPWQTKFAQAILVGTHGTVKLVAPDGTVITVLTTNDGEIIPIPSVRVNSSSTTADNMYALY